VPPAHRAIVMLGLFAIATRLADLDFWGNIGAIVAAVVSVLILLWGIGAWLRRRWLLCRPIRATYLIPQAKYKLKAFPGGPPEEQTPEELSIGVGLYELMHRLEPRQAIELDSVRLEFWGPQENLPENQRVSEPMVVDYQPNDQGGRDIVDWHGIWKSGRGLPRMLPKGEAWVVGHWVRAPGPWEGTVRLYLTLRAEPASKTHIEELSLRVDPDGDDELAFLRRD
jgi:hypothetical protein